MEVFKIRRPDGLFSTGGSSPSFNTKGKTWTTRGAVSSHLGLLSPRDLKDRYEGAEIITMKMVDVDSEPIAEAVKGLLARREKRNALYEKRIAEWRREEALRARKKAEDDLARIAKQYPDLGR